MKAGEKKHESRKLSFSLLKQVLFLYPWQNIWSAVQKNKKNLSFSLHPQRRSQSVAWNVAFRTLVSKRLKSCSWNLILLYPILGSISPEMLLLAPNDSRSNSGNESNQSGKTPDKLFISSWNVNGIRAVITKEDLPKYLASSKPDIICIN